MQYSKLKARIESILGSVFLPAVVAHEYCHLLVYRIFGVEAEVQMHDFDPRDLQNSHVSVGTRSDPRAEFWSTFSPYLLLPIAFLALLLGKQLYDPDKLGLQTISIIILVQSLGFVAQAGPSGSDLRGYVKTESRRGREVSYRKLKWIHEIIFYIIVFSWWAVFAYDFIIEPTVYTQIL